MSKSAPASRSKAAASSPEVSQGKHLGEHSLLGATAIQDIPARRAVVDVLLAAEVPNPGLLRPAAASLVEIVQRNPWVLTYLAPDAPYELLRGLAQVAGDAQRGKIEDLALDTAFTTLAGNANSKMHIDRLRAVYLLANQRRRSGDPSQRLPKTAIKTLGEKIRALETRGSGLLGAQQLSSAFDSKSLSEIGESVGRDLAGQSSQLARDWPQTWIPWIERVNSAIRKPPAPENEDDDPHLPWAAFPGPDDDGGGDSDFELPVPPAASTQKGQVPTSRVFAAAFADQAIRSQNRELSKDHVGVATDSEVRVVVRHCETVYDGVATPLLDLPPTLLLLETCTGRNLEVLADAYILPRRPPAGERHLLLDLERGVLIVPVLTPPNIRVPFQGASASFEPNDGTIELCLPHLVVAFLRRLRSWRHADRVADWLDGVDPRLMIGWFLRGIPELPERSERALARFRRWLSCQVQETGGDIAATMLITGDSFGRSTAPLHYYSPKSADLAALHHRSLKPFFRMPDLAPGGIARVGPASIAAPAIAKTGVVRIGRRLSVSSEKALQDRDRAARYHNLLTDHLSQYIAIISTHRPTQPLYALTRRNFDLCHHWAILQDKDADPEHFTRLVATTPALSESIGYYLSSLLLLCNRWGTPGAQLAAQAVMQGHLPLLQYMAESGELRCGNGDDLKRARADCWASLPENWHRPFMAMALREAGAQPLAVHAQMGHLEAASHPFLEDSVLSPAEIAGAVRPVLESIERDLGFRVIRGFAPKGYTPPFLTHQNWTDSLQQHDLQKRLIARKQAGLIRAGLKPNRVAASKWLLDAVDSVNPELAVLIGHLRARRDTPRPGDLDESLKRMQIPDANILELMARNESEHLGENQGLWICIHNLLCRWLRMTVSDAEAKVMDIGLINLSPRAELSPLLVSNCAATEQLGAMRDWFVQQLRIGRQFDRQVLRVLALLLYEGLREPEEILEISKSRQPPLRVSDDGCVVCLDVPGRRGPVTFAGLPALALCREITGATTASTLPDLSRRLAAYLPANFIPDDVEETLNYWADTAKIACRIEKAGLFRFDAGRSGVLEASIDQQAAFFAKAFPLNNKTASQIATPPDAVIELAAPVQKPLTSKTTAALWRRYRSVQTALGNPAKTFSNFKQALPQSAAYRQPTLSLMVGALDLCEPPAEVPASLDIVRAIAGFARDLCENGTRKKRVPAVNTVRTYIHGIARDLLDIFGDTDLHLLEEEDFEDAYQLIQQVSERRRSGARAAMVLSDFHHFLVEHHDIPPVNTPWFGGPMDDDPRPDPVLLSEAHYLGARTTLVDIIDGEAKDDVAESTWRRSVHAACVVLILLRRSGARISEGALLRQVDLWLIGESIFLILRPSVFRQLKTAAATRRINLTDRLDEVEKRVVSSWLRSERVVHAAGERKTLLFPVLGEPSRSMGVQLIRTLIQSAFRAGADIEVRPHDLRHLWLTEETDRVSRAVIESQDLMSRVRLFERVRLEEGHTRLTTGASHYVHSRVGPCRSSNASTVFQPSRWLLSGFSGSKVNHVDVLRQRHVAEGVSQLGLIWEDVVFSRVTNVGRAPSIFCHAANVGMPTVEHAPITVNKLDRYIRTLREAPIDANIRVSFGLSEIAAAGILASIGTLGGAPCYLRLLPSLTRRGHARMHPLPRTVDQPLIDHMFERATPEHCRAARSALMETFRPKGDRLDCFLGTDDQLHHLRELLIALGLDGEAIEIRENRLKTNRHGKFVGRFHAVCWALSVMTIYSEMLSAEADRVSLAAVESAWAGSR